MGFLSIPLSILKDKYKVRYEENEVENIKRMGAREQANCSWEEETRDLQEFGEGDCQEQGPGEIR